MRALLGADQVRMLQVTQDRSGAAEALLADGDERSDGYLRFGDGPSGTASVIASGRPLAVPDARTSTAIVPGRAEHHGIASSLFIPVAWAGEVRDVVIVGWTERRDISAEDIDTAQLIADQAAAGFARLEADERRAAGSVQDRAVVRAAAALNASLDLQEVLLTLVHEAALALDADMSGVYLGDGENGAVATAGYSVPEGWHGLHVAPGKGAAGQALVTGEPFVSSDYQNDVDAPVMADCRTAVAVPMAWDNQMRGALSVGWTTRRRVHDEDLRTLRGDRRPRHRRLPQRRGLRARPARRPHRRADRRPQPRRDAAAHPRGDRPRPP